MAKPTRRLTRKQALSFFLVYFDIDCVLDFEHAVRVQDRQEILFEKGKVFWRFFSVT